MRPVSAAVPSIELADDNSAADSLVKSIDMKAAEKVRDSLALLAAKPIELDRSSTYSAIRDAEHDYSGYYIGMYFGAHWIVPTRNATHAILSNALDMCSFSDENNDDRIKEQLTVLYYAFPARFKHEDDRRNMMNTYFGQLRPVPADLVKLSVQRILEADQFFPSVARIREAHADCAKTLTRFRKAIDRLRVRITQLEE